MKKIIILAIGLATLLSCTNLDIPVESELTPSNFPYTEEQFVTAAGSAYNEFAMGYVDNYWLMSELAADGAVLTANGGNWYDGGHYKDLHFHTWHKNSDLSKQAWVWLSTTINKCNSVAELFQKSPDSEAKQTAIAELTVLRAMCYYLFIDNFGDVPLMLKFGEPLKGRTPRKDVFDFIEKDVKEALPHLRDVNDKSSYGRPNKMTAFALLAKLYLNAEVFTKAQRYNEAISMCDSVIVREAKGLVKLESDYLKMFDYDNGPQFKEFIFAIPYDENNLKSFRPARYWLSVHHPAAWGLKFTTSSCMRAVPSYYDKFTEDPLDQRQKIWLTEGQYLRDGVTPMMLEATKVQLDSRYNGADKDDKVQFQVRLTKEIEFRNIPNFDTGDDIVGRLVGYRCNKYNPSTSQLERFQSNDMPVFRYADILLMKAEALLRTKSSENEALRLVNSVRLRAGASAWTSLTLDQLLDERARELSYESWRRNDLIRFGKFEDRWLLKTDKDPNKQLFAVPQSEIEANPLLLPNNAGF